jgi:L-rhamnose mutarotase
MKSFAQALDLHEDPELIELYKQHHRDVWPEVVEGLRQIGITKMKIFLLGSHLFMYCEAHDTFDPARDYQRYAANARTQEWDQLMRRFQQRVPEAGPDDWWTPMEEVFDLDRF